MLKETVQALQRYSVFSLAFRDVLSRAVVGVFSSLGRQRSLWPGNGTETPEGILKVIHGSEDNAIN